MSAAVRNPVEHRIRHWEDGARRVGGCRERGCGGSLLLVEAMGAWEWAQCDRCLVQTGLGQGRPDAAVAKDGEDPAPAAGKGEDWAF